MRNENFSYKKQEVERTFFSELFTRIKFHDQGTKQDLHGITKVSKATHKSCRSSSLIPNDSLFWIIFLSKKTLFQHVCCLAISFEMLSFQCWIFLARLSTERFCRNGHKTKTFERPTRVHRFLLQNILLFRLSGVSDRLKGILAGLLCRLCLHRNCVNVSHDKRPPLMSLKSLFSSRFHLRHKRVHGHCRWL
jgi:hypothetical protein